MTEETKMETTMNKEPVTLQSIPYDEKFRLNQASASQLVKGLEEMASRLSEPQNDYQKELYPAIKNIVSRIVEKYSELLESTTEVEQEVRRFNLQGYNGKIKKAVSTKGVKFNLVYKFANFGDYFKTIVQRLTYLVDRQLPQRYVNNAAEGDAYNILKGKIWSFIKFMNEDIEQSWNTIVTAARTAGGDSVQENLRKRTEKIKVKITNKKEFSDNKKYNKYDSSTKFSKNDNNWEKKYISKDSGEKRVFVKRDTTNKSENKTWTPRKSY